MAKQYRSAIHAAVHEKAEGLRDTGALCWNSMKAFDDLCLIPIEPLTAAQFRLREKAGRSGIRALPQRDDGSR